MKKVLIILLSLTFVFMIAFAVGCQKETDTDKDNDQTIVDPDDPDDSDDPDNPDDSDDPEDPEDGKLNIFGKEWQVTGNVEKEDDNVKISTSNNGNDFANHMQTLLTGTNYQVIVKLNFKNTQPSLQAGITIGTSNTQYFKLCRMFNGKINLSILGAMVEQSQVSAEINDTYPETLYLMFIRNGAQFAVYASSVNTQSAYIRIGGIFSLLPSIAESEFNLGLYISNWSENSGNAVFSEVTVKEDVQIFNPSGKLDAYGLELDKIGNVTSDLSCVTISSDSEDPLANRTEYSLTNTDGTIITKIDFTQVQKATAGIMFYFSPNAQLKFFADKTQVGVEASGGAMINVPDAQSVQIENGVYLKTIRNKSKIAFYYSLDGETYKMLGEQEYYNFPSGFDNLLPELSLFAADTENQDVTFTEFVMNSESEIYDPQKFIFAFGYELDTSGSNVAFANNKLTIRVSGTYEQNFVGKDVDNFNSKVAAGIDYKSSSSDSVGLFLKGGNKSVTLLRQNGKVVLGGTAAVQSVETEDVFSETAYLMLIRRGTDVAGYVSNDNENWTMLRTTLAFDEGETQFISGVVAQSSQNFAFDVNWLSIGGGMIFDPQEVQSNQIVAFGYVWDKIQTEGLRFNSADGSVSMDTVNRGQAGIALKIPSTEYDAILKMDFKTAKSILQAGLMLKSGNSEFMLMRNCSGATDCSIQSYGETSFVTGGANVGDNIENSIKVVIPKREVEAFGKTWILEGVSDFTENSFVLEATPESYEITNSASLKLSGNQYSFTAKMQYPKLSNGSLQSGIMLSLDDSTYIKLVRRNGAFKLYSENNFLEDIYIENIDDTISGNAVYLKFIRNNNLMAFYISGNGTEWVRFENVYKLSKAVESSAYLDLYLFNSNLSEEEISQSSVFSEIVFSEEIIFNPDPTKIDFAGKLFERAGNVSNHSDGSIIIDLSSTEFENAASILMQEKNFLIMFSMDYYANGEAGLYLKNAEGNILKFIRSDENLIFGDNSVSVSSTSKLYLQVIKNANQFAGYYSLDGITWTLIGIVVFENNDSVNIIFSGSAEGSIMINDFSEEKDMLIYDPSKPFEVFGISDWQKTGNVKLNTDYGVNILANGGTESNYIGFEVGNNFVAEVKMVFLPDEFALQAGFYFIKDDGTGVSLMRCYGDADKIESYGTNPEFGGVSIPSPTTDKNVWFKIERTGKDVKLYYKTVENGDYILFNSGVVDENAQYSLRLFGASSSEAAMFAEFYDFSYQEA